MCGQGVLVAAYGALIPVVSELDDSAAWQASRCAGWTVRDVVFHLLSDAQRGLVALHTLSSLDPDVDAVTYWRSWQPELPGADAERRTTRTAASLWTRVRPLAELFVETAQAVLVAAEERSELDVVWTQGHALTVPDLCSTLAVEVTVHHLDVRLGSPSSRGLAETRLVLDGLLGRQLPIASDIRYALIGTGRELPEEEELSMLGSDAGRLPLFG